MKQPYNVIYTNRPEEDRKERLNHLHQLRINLEREHQCLQYRLIKIDKQRKEIQELIMWTETTYLKNGEINFHNYGIEQVE